MLYTNHIG